MPSTARSLLAVVAAGLHAERRAPLSWGGGLGALCALVVAIWPSVQDALGQAISNYPEALKQAFGIASLDTVEQYLDAEMLSLIVPIAVAVLAVRCAGRPIAGAEERGHLDVLLSAPLDRRVLAAGAFLTAALVVAQVLAVVYVVTLVAGAVAGAGLHAGDLAAGMANVWPLAMAFAGLSLAACGVLHRLGAVTAVGGGAVVAAYVIDLAGRLDDALGGIRVVSAFRYYGSAIQHGLDATHVLVLVAAGGLLAAAGALAFERRDVL